MIAMMFPSVSLNHAALAPPAVDGNAFRQAGNMGDEPYVSLHFMGAASYAQK